MVDSKSPALERMQCMEIWGGNQAVQKSFRAPGLDIYVHSEPYGKSPTGGGDIYYLTSCASGRISRFLLADVSGHGENASQLAISLRDLMRQNVNKISQEQFVQQMNREFGNLADDSGFATAIVATFFEPSKKLSVSVAGHPYPFYYRATRQNWVHLDPAKLSGEAIGNMPLGIHNESNYPGRDFKTEPGDMFLLYSDAFCESLNANNQQIGIAGLLEFLNQNKQPQPNEVIPALRRQIGQLAQQNLQDDDATLILGYFTSTKVQLRDNLMAPFRWLGQVCDQTQLRECPSQLPE